VNSAPAVRSSGRVVSCRNVMSERDFTSLDKAFVVGWGLGLGGVVAEGMTSSLRHVVRDMLLLVMHRVLLRVSGMSSVMLRMSVKMSLRMTVHHYRMLLLLLTIVRGVVLRACSVVNVLLLNEDFFVVLTSRVRISACRTGCWWSSMRRMRSWTPIVEAIVFLDVHQTRT
jgi:hypothetical protein